MTQESQEHDFAALFQESSAKVQSRLEPGQKITATIVSIAGSSVFIDIGGKNEGVIELNEFTQKDGDSLVTTAVVGDTVSAYFLKSVGGSQMFTRKLGSGKNITHLEEAWRNGIPVEGLVKEEVKGGFEITLGGSTRAFCPFSQMGMHRVADAAAEYSGRRLLFLITRCEENGRNIVVSARALIEQEREQQKEQLQASLEEGMTVTGTISSLRDFGAFVDLGGVEGLIPLAEIGWSRVNDIREHLTVGQEVTVVIKKLDWPANRISLSLKAAAPNPWDTVRETFAEGSLHTGVVSRLTSFGAFVALAPGVDGLIHISRLGGGRKIHHPREVVENGQTIEVKVEKVDQEGQKISLVPADFVSVESEKVVEEDEYKKYLAQKAPKKEEADLGSFGALLQAQLRNKK